MQRALRQRKTSVLVGARGTPEEVPPSYLVQKLSSVLEWANDSLLLNKWSFFENQFFQNIRYTEVKMKGSWWGKGCDHHILLTLLDQKSKAPRGQGTRCLRSPS